MAGKKAVKTKVLAFNDKAWSRKVRALKDINKQLGQAVDALKAAQKAITEVTKLPPGGPGNVKNKITS
jgi:hypothetical protein